MIPFIQTMWQKTSFRFNASSDSYFFTVPYKFQIDDIKTGDRFRIEIRSYTEPTAEPKILWSHEFVKTQFTCRGPLCDPAKQSKLRFVLTLEPIRLIQWMH